MIEALLILLSFELFTVGVALFVGFLWGRKHERKHITNEILNDLTFAPLKGKQSDIYKDI